MNNKLNGLAISLVLGFSLQAQEKPNILMLCVDDMNDWVGFLGGHPQTITPNMDRLAKKGVNFTNAHCPSPGCSPSRNAILIGIEPHNSGLYPFYNINNIEDGVLNDYTPLPLLFRNNGYITCGITKVFHNPDNAYRQNEFWDEYRSFGDGSMNLLKDEGYYPEPYNKRMVACPASNPLTDFMDYKNAQHAVGFLKRTHEKPFFLAVGFIRPHTPWIAPKANYDKFNKPIVAPEILVDDLEDIPLAGQANAQLYMDYPIREDNAWSDMRRGYLACINFIDDNVGRVLEALNNSPYADNTIVVLWSDHGFHLGEKRSFSKFSLWNEATRTPFIIYDPRGQNGNGSRCDEPVGLINVYRTLCDMAGLTPPEYVDGMSLTPWLANPQKQNEKPAMTTWGRGNYTFRTKEWRYTRYFDGTEELYAEQCDPNEWNNLADNPEYKELKESFQKWLPQIEAPQVKSGIELYNVADADDPQRNINSYLNNVKKYSGVVLVSPDAPTNLKANSITGFGFTLSWDAPGGDVTGYRVYKDGSFEGSTDLNSIKISGLNKNTVYQFLVRAKSSEGHVSPNSVALVVQTNNEEPLPNFFYIENKNAWQRIKPVSADDASSLEIVATTVTDDWVQWEEVQISDEYFYLKNKQSGMYISPASAEDGALLEMRATNSSGDGTQWSKVNVDGEYFHIKNKSTEKYIRLISGSDNSLLDQQPGNWVGQWTQWRFVNADSNTSVSRPSSQNVVFYPNPAKNLLYLKNAPTGRVDIYQIDGKKVVCEKYIPGDPIDISSLQDSIYVLRLPEYGGLSFTFVKNSKL